MSGIDDFLTPAQRQAAEWMRVPRTGPQWGDDEPTRYESHAWDGNDECAACGVTWEDCEDECPQSEVGR
jgi:hypothetical protein